ncbi:MAG: hypothetical protein JXX14_04545 [Deltaproteobacteria bacterium]|nr:hypothetical protein [Deltaproteobacteria bacterium]
MKKNIAYYLVSCVITLMFCGGCDYLEADDVCYPSEDAVEECSDLDDRLELCDPDAEISIPGCHVEQRCDGDGKNCDQFCTGKLVPCDQLARDACDVAPNCQWWSDPNNIDRDVE